MIENPEIPGKPRPPKPRYLSEDQLRQAYEKIIRDEPGSFYANAAVLRLAALNKG